MSACARCHKGRSAGKKLLFLRPGSKEEQCFLATNDELSRGSLERWHVPESSSSSPRFYHKLCLVHAKKAHDKIKQREKNEKRKMAREQKKEAEEAAKRLRTSGEFNASASAAQPPITASETLFSNLLDVGFARRLASQPDVDDVAQSSFTMLEPLDRNQSLALQSIPPLTDLTDWNPSSRQASSAASHPPATFDSSAWVRSLRISKQLKEVVDVLIPASPACACLFVWNAVLAPGVADAHSGKGSRLFHSVLFPKPAAQLAKSSPEKLATAFTGMVGNMAPPGSVHSSTTSNGNELHIARPSGPREGVCLQLNLTGVKRPCLVCVPLTANID